jgi:WD40 repeat protein
MPISSNKLAPYIYSAMFNNRYDTIMAAGAGQNQVRHFDYETGEVLAVITDVPKAVLCMTKAHHSHDFAFGSADHKVRIFEQKKHLAAGTEEEVLRIDAANN